MYSLLNTNSLRVEPKRRIGLRTSPPPPPSFSSMAMTPFIVVWKYPFWR